MNMQAVVLSYNHPQLTSRCIDSCLRFFKEKDIHLIHNGSQNQFVQQQLEKFPGISHHILETNKGFTGGANQALARVFKKADWALFITNDCELLSMNIPTENLKPGLYAPLIYRRKSQRVDSFGGHLDTQTGKLSHVTEPKGSGQLDCQFYVPGTAFIIDKNSYKKAGGFDEKLGTYWEDVDFSLRCHKLKIPLRQTKDFVFRHGVGKTCHKHSYYTNYLFQRNRIRICRRWRAGSEFHFFKDTVKGCFFKAQHGNWPEAWRRIKAHIDA